MTRALLLSLALLAFSAAPALASGTPSGGDGCNYSLTHRSCDDDGDSIVVVPEPAGANCPNGGVKIIVFKDDSDYDIRNDKDHHGDSHHKVFFVCNGEDGQDGEPGPPGAPGENGTGVTVAAEPAGVNCANGGIAVTPIASDGTAGTVFYVCNGIDGAPGPAGPAGPPGPAGPQGSPGAPGTTRATATCASTRVTTWVLTVRRGHRVRGFRARFEGVHARVRRSTFHGRFAYKVRINMRGLPHGIYVARARYSVSKNGAAFKRTQRVHYYRACYGNPKGGGITGPNRFSVTVL